MVGRKLRFDVVLVGGEGHGHDASVIDHDVNFRDCLVDDSCSLADGIKVVELNGHEGDFDRRIKCLDLGDDRRHFVLGPGKEQQVCWFSMRQRERCLRSHASVAGARDEDGLAFDFIFEGVDDFDAGGFTSESNHAVKCSLNVGLATRLIQEVRSLSEIASTRMRH